MYRLSHVLLGVAILALFFAVAATAYAADTEGKIKSVAADKNEFVMTDGNNKSWTFILDKGGKVIINDKDAKLADLQAGDTVKVTYEKKDDKLMASEVRVAKK
jgi:hypothetical protein